MRVRMPVNEKSVGLREHIGIPIRGSNDPAEPLALPESLVADGDVLRRDALRRLHRRIEAETLLRCATCEIRVRAQLLPLVGITNERENAVPDEVHRSFVSREQ